MARPPDHTALDHRYPTASDLERASYRRIPRFAYDYLAGGTGNEAALARNRKCLDAHILSPDLITADISPRPDVTLFGRTYRLPIGIAPIGLSGLIWPGMARYFATTARQAGIPAILSTVATTGLAEFSRLAGANGWFQLYIPNDEKITADLISRARDAGYGVLVVTIDVPVLARRPRDIRNGLSLPLKISPRTIFQAAIRPRWSLSTLINGLPEFENLKTYVPTGTSMRSAASYTSSLARGHVTPERLEKVRQMWPGKLVVKGIMTTRDAKTAIELCADALYVSNHGARQLDAAEAVLKVIPRIRKTAGPDMPLLADSGIRSGLDIARMINAGADFTFAARPFAHATGALARHGPAHMLHIFKAELEAAMIQLGCETIADLKKLSHP